MSQQLSDLENILKQLVGEHGRLVEALEAQQAAMRALDLKAMDEALRRQDACRARIMGLENFRRSMTGQIARSARIEGEVTIQRLAELFPGNAARLLELRRELRSAMEQVQGRTQVSGKLAGAVLGHLNTAVGLLAAAVEPAGVYTKQGVPRVGSRIGVLEAVG